MINRHGNAYVPTAVKEYDDEPKIFDLFVSWSHVHYDVKIKTVFYSFEAQVFIEISCYEK